MNEDLQNLISRVCDHQATESELAQLAQRLRSDVSARDEYLRYVDLHAALCDEALPTFESDIVDYRTDPHRTDLHRGVLAQTGSHNHSETRAALGWIATAAAILIAVGFGFLALRRPAVEMPNRNSVTVAAVPAIATMLLSDDCRWQGGGFSEGQRLNPGRVGLDQGTAVLRFDGGAELVLVGPATIDLQTSTSVLVHLGDVVVRATDGAEGFVVLTPTSEVIDLGTEFAVKVRRSGATEVHVMDGEVSYRGINAAQELTEILHAGQGVMIDPQGRPTAVPMNSPRFQDFVNRVNPGSRADLLIAYEGFNYSPGVLPLTESTVGKGWAGPWRKRSDQERTIPSTDDSPDDLEIVHGQMNVTWPVPGGRLGMLKLPGDNVYYVRPLKRTIDLDHDGVTFFCLMVRETQRRMDSDQPKERLRLTFRSSRDYRTQAISFGHGPGYRPTVQTGDGVAHTSPILLPAEQTTLWIGKIVSRKQGEDEIYFRVYGESDVLDYAEPATWHVVTRGVNLDAHLDLVLLSSVGKTARLIDELRIGPTWRSVAPILESKE
ncbi:FecR family protein [Stieleria sp. TO1_6]|uniref:FecR family protein n=1 Tax=Stieleria tagensis TaxID=2956795 RepID=UPI00209B3718|nr:FecR family protein [Stieleria tagensis]MCO8124176.1 FecR family protein [Stieleria tagensis]